MSTMSPSPKSDDIIQYFTPFSENDFLNPVSPIPLPQSLASIVSLGPFALPLKGLKQTAIVVSEMPLLPIQEYSTLDKLS